MSCLSTIISHYNQELRIVFQVTEPQISSADLQALTSGSGAIADKVLAGDTQAAAQLITAVCSVLNTRAAADQTTSNKTVTPDGKVLTPEEKKKQEEEAAKAKAAATEVRRCEVMWSCGFVWCGMVWCGMVWCDMVWFGILWCDKVWCQYGVV